MEKCSLKFATNSSLFSWNNTNTKLIAATQSTWQEIFVSGYTRTNRLVFDYQWLNYFYYVIFSSFIANSILLSILLSFKTIEEFFLCNFWRDFVWCFRLGSTWTWKLRNLDFIQSYKVLFRHFYNTNSILFWPESI